MRLQVLLPDAEMDEIRQVAEREHLSVGEWVRRSLREAREGRPVKSAESKLAAVRRAVEFDFPTGDIDQMLAEIERGYHE
ncbi:MAG: antitoxin [Acidobacteriota bacterium]